LQGRRINPASLEEAMLAVEWLFDFQNKTKSTTMTQEDVSLEIDEIRRGLSNLPMFNTLNIEKWLNDYYILSQKLNITKSAQHGDFFWGNILFDPKTKQLHVIDWEYYKENSNPLFDFIYFIITAMGLPYDSANGFRNNLSDNGLVGPTVLRALIARAKEHFGAEFDLNILMPYALLRYVSTTLLLYVSTKSLEQKQHLQKNNIIILHEELFENMAKLLRVLSSSQSTLSSSSLND
jgi:Choline/ethanolamine kinase